MVRKGNKKDGKKSKSKTSVRTTSPKSKRPRTSVAEKKQSTSAQPPSVNGLIGLLDKSSIALCFFDADDKITFCTEKFAALTKSSIESLIGKKLKKNVLWGVRGVKDEFQALYNKAKESGTPLIVDALHINSDRGEPKTWNLRLLPQADDDRRYSGMGLVIEDVSGNELPSGSTNLFHRLYTAASQHLETQPLLEELVCMLKDFSRCDSVKILIADKAGNRLLKAESDSKPGLWDKDHSLSAATINSFFIKKDDRLNSLYTHGGSLYLNDVNAFEGMLDTKLKELVVNTCNSYGFNSLALIPVELGDAICGFIQLANKNRDIAEDTIATVENVSELLQIILERIALKREIHSQRESLLKQMHGRGAHLEALSERLKQEAAERKIAQEELQIRKDLAVALAGTEKIEDALQLCLDTAIRVSGMDSGGIYVVDPATASLNLACSRGLSESFVTKVSHYEASERNAALILEGRPLYSPEDIDIEDTSLIPSEGLKSIAVVPVLHQGKAIACLNIASRVLDSIPHSARNALEAVAAEIGSTIARIRVREALTESEGRYAILFAQSKNPVLVIDEDGNYIEGNEAALSFLECTREELLRMNVRDTLPPYLDDEWLAGYRKIWETGGRVERDFYVWGKIKVLELTITPLKVGSRKMIFSIGTDITERKRLEHELRTSEEKHRSILEQMQDACYEIDLEGRYTFVNDAMCRVLWYTREELIGKRYRLLVPEEDLDKVYQVFYQVYETGMPNIGFAHKIRRKDGAVMIAESSITLLKNERGEPVGYLCIGRDITQRIRLEEAAKHSEEKYRTILEEMDEAYAECDPKGNLTFVNDATCRQLGYTREELIGMNYKVFSSPDDRHERIRVFSKVFQTGEPVYWWPTQMISKDGTRIHVENSIFPLRNEKGEIMGLRVVRRNVTESKIAAQELEKRALMLDSAYDSIIAFDTEGNISYVNERAYRTRGYERDELLTMNIRQLVAVEYIPLLEERLAATLERGELEFQAEHVRKDGSTFPVEGRSRLIDVAGQNIIVSGYTDISLRKKAEIALVESESKYRSLVESGGASIAVVDMEGKFAFANDTLCRMAGYSKEELLGKNFMDFVHPEDRDRDTQLFLEAVGKDKTDIHLETRVLHKDGHIIWLYTSPVELKINDKLVGFSVILQDITERKEAEEKIERLNLVLQAISLVNQLIVREKDRDQLLQLACDSLVNTRGFKSAGIVLLDEAGSYLTLKQAGLGEGLIDFVEGLKQGNIPYCIKCALERSGPAEITDKISQCVDCPLWTADQGNPLVSARLWYDEKIYGVLTVSVPEKITLDKEEMELVGEVAGDIAFALHNIELELEKKKSDDALHESEEHFRSLAEESPDMIFIHDMRRIVYVNKLCEEVMGYSREELYAETFDFMKLIAPEYRDRLRESFAEHVAGKEVPQLEYSLETRGGSSIDVLLNTKLLMYSHKPAILGVVTDVTEMKKMERALEKSEQRYRTIIEEIDESYVEVDLNGNITFVNDAFSRRLGYSKDEMMGLNYKAYTPPDQIREKARVYSGVARTGTPVYWHPFVNLRIDGQPLFSEVCVFPLRNEKGEIIGLRAVSRDVTKAKLDEHELQKRALLLDSAYDSIIAFDSEGNISYVNERACQTRGYERDELMTMNIRQLVTAEHIPLLEERLAAILERGELEFQAEHVRKDGSTFPVEGRSRLITVSGQQIVVSGYTDISLRKRAEETVRQNEEKYGTILEEIDEHYSEVDARGNFTFVNEAMCRSFGYSREEMIGMNYKKYTPPEGLKHRLEVFSEVFKTGKPTYWQLFEDIVRDGSRHLVEISIFPLKDNRGEIVGLRTVGRDVTDRKQAEAALRESEERYRLLAENSLDVIFTIDMNMQLTYVSPSVTYLTGLGAEEVLTIQRQNKLTAESLGVSLRDGHRFQQSLKALAEDPSRTEVFEFALKHRDGYIKWAEVQMSILRDKFGQVAGILGVIRDISQQKKMTERLVSADRLASLGEMAAGLAHEVNNPLTAVMGFSYLLLQNPDTPEDVRNDVEAIYREGKRAAEIIRSFLTFARGQKPEKQAIYINDILEEVLKLRHNQMEKENIQVNISFWEDLPAIQGDISQLQQVFLNIILNAEYFMYRTNKRGTLIVDTKLTDGKVIVVIKDDGPGIAPEAISRVFDPFYTTKDVGEGTGLGLSICHGIIMEHGGTIFAESEPGQGATLTVELPVK